MIAFGPVPSRRLGRSLGINNIPPKICSYSCVYCQVGRTDQLRIERAPFYAPETVYEAITQKNALIFIDRRREHIHAENPIGVIHTPFKSPAEALSQPAAGRQ